MAMATRVAVRVVIIRGHFIFSTKNRQPLITADLESDLHSYLGGIIR